MESHDVARIICQALTSGYVVAAAAGRRLLRASEAEGNGEGQWSGGAGLNLLKPV